MAHSQFNRSHFTALNCKREHTNHKQVQNIEDGLWCEHGPDEQVMSLDECDRQAHECRPATAHEQRREEITAKWRVAAPERDSYPRIVTIGPANMATPMRNATIPGEYSVIPT